MLTIDTRDGIPAEAVVTVHPMRAGGTSLAALALLRIPAPNSERLASIPALMRRQMLDDTFTRIGDTLDIDHLARELTTRSCPPSCNAGDLLLLESLAGDDELPCTGPTERCRCAGSRCSTTGRIPRLGGGLPHRRDLALPEAHALLPLHGHRHAGARDDHQQEPGRRDRQGRAAQAGGQAALGRLHGDAAWLIARGTMLGFFACTRQEGFRRFDAYDVEIGMDFASRAAMFIYNARRYSREHATALTLQRSMLPTGLSRALLGRGQAPVPARQQAHRGRRRLVRVHRAARRPGRAGGRRRGRARRARRRHHGAAAHRHPYPGHARAASRRLAAAARRAHAYPRRARTALRHLRLRGVRRGQRRHPRWRWPAMLPPLLVHPDGSSNELLDVPPAPPLGIGDGEVESRRFKDRGRQPVRPVHRRPGGEQGPGHQRRAGPAARHLRPGARRRARPRICARRRWTGCTPTTSATTSRCSSPGCGGCPRTATPHGRSHREADLGPGRHVRCWPSR